MNHNPVFGKKEPDLRYKIRIGVYAVIPDEKNEKLLIIQAPNSAFLLPGGEMEKNESRLETLTRELHEEVGGVLQVNGLIGSANEFYYSHFRGQAFENPGYFYYGSQFKFCHEPWEKGNKLFWLPVDEAKLELKRESHRWAVEQWQRNIK